MDVPRLPPKLERRVLHAACGLRPRLRRALFGRPPRIDGFDLAGDVHALLSLATLNGSNSLGNGQPPAQARVFNEGIVATSSGEPTPVAEVRELEIPGPGGPLPARLYIPRGAPPEPRPLLIFYPGGGWVIGGFYSHEEPCRFLAAHSGVAVLCAPYRLAPEHPFPAAVEDASAIFEWAAANAAELGIDPERIALGGDSAGGNLATVTSLLARDREGPQPALQLLIYPVTDARGTERSRRLFAHGFILTRPDTEAFERHYIRGSANDPRISVIEAPDLSGLPPTLIYTAGFDPLRDEGEAYARRLLASGVPTEHRRYTGLIHTFINLTGVCGSCRAAMTEIAADLRGRLQDPAVVGGGAQDQDLGRRLPQ